MEGRAYKLQFPWIGVVNRSQQDINKNVDMIAARRREKEYFSSTPEYRHMANRMGSEHLGKVMSKVCYILKECLFSILNCCLSALGAETFLIGACALPF